jgi:multiple sugar transport system substrate-binding protein
MSHKPIGVCNGDGTAGVTRRHFLSMAGAAGAAAAFPTILTACGQGAQPASSGSGGKVQPGTLSVFIGKDTSYPTQQAQGMNVLLELFQKKFPGSSFTWDTYASADEELTRLETSAAAHEGPDIFEFGSTLVPTAYASKSFEIITNSMWDELGGKSAFIEAQLTMSGPSPDKLIAVPKTANPYAMVYNTKLFQQAGLSKPPTTWTEFVDYAKEMTSGGTYGTVVDLQDGFDPWHYVWLFTTDLGGTLLSKDGKRATLDSPEVEEAASFWLDWIAKYGIANRIDATYKGADRTKAFANGAVGMIPMVGPGGIKAFSTSPVAGSYAWAPNPTVPYGMKTMPKNGKPAQGFVSGQYWTIFKYSKNKELAFELIKLMTSPEIQYQFFKQDAQVPVTWATFSKYPETKQSPWDIFVPAEQKSYPTNFSGAFGQLEVVIGQAINKMATQIATTGTYKRADLAAALKQANTQLQAALAQQSS